MKNFNYESIKQRVGEIGFSSSPPTAIISRSTWFCTFNNYLPIPFHGTFLVYSCSHARVLIFSLFQDCIQNSKRRVWCVEWVGKSTCGFSFFFSPFIPSSFSIRLRITDVGGGIFAFSSLLFLAFFFFFRGINTTQPRFSVWCYSYLLLASLSMLSCFSPTEKCHH